MHHRFFNQIFSFAILIGMMGSCYQPPDENQLNYSADQSRHLFNSIHVETSLWGTATDGRLTLELKLKNRSNQIIIVDYLNCDLTIDAERVAMPEVNGTLISELSPGQEASYMLTYHPVNDADVFMRTQYRGDLKKKYILALDFIFDKQGRRLLNDSVTFALSSESFNRYTSLHARESAMRIYDFHFDPETFAREQQAYLRITMNDVEEFEHVVNAYTPSLTINRIIINIFAYKEGDTLVVNMRMLNQDTQPLMVIREEMHVHAMGMTFSPASVFSDSFADGLFPENTFIFKPGTRLHLLLKYHAPFSLEEWELDNDMLRIRTQKRPKSYIDEWKNFIGQPIPFVQSPITKYRKQSVS